MQVDKPPKFLYCLYIDGTEDGVGMKVKNIVDVKELNKNNVLSVLITRAPISRTEIAQATGLSKMSVTNLINELIGDRLVEEVKDSSAYTVGRPAGYLSILPKSRLILGLYISQSFIQVCQSDLCGEIYRSAKTPLDPHETKDTFRRKIIASIQGIISEDNLPKLIGIGVSTIGVVQRQNGAIISAVNFHGIREVPVSEWLREIVSCPVVVDTDSNASALGEMYFGHAKDIDNFLYVGIADGIGAGIIAQRNLYTGDRGYSGEFGHISVDINGPICSCGNRGCLEGFASAARISKLAHDLLSLGGVDTRLTIENTSFDAIASLACGGDEFCVGLLRKMCFYISSGLATLINLLDPAAVFMGHDFALAGNLGVGMIKEYLENRYVTFGIKPLDIRLSAFSDASPLIGSVALVVDKAVNNLLPL